MYFGMSKLNVTMLTGSGGMSVFSGPRTCSTGAYCDMHTPYFKNVTSQYISSWFSSDASGYVNTFQWSSASGKIDDYWFAQVQCLWNNCLRSSMDVDDNLQKLSMHRENRQHMGM